MEESQGNSKDLNINLLTTIQDNHNNFIFNFSKLFIDYDFNYLDYFKL